MQQDPKDIILELLTIIGYEDNKETYANDFIQNCEQQALIDALSALPTHQRDAFKQRMLWTHDQGRAKEIIAEYIAPEQYKQALQKASADVFKELLEAVMPTLSREQVDKLHL